MSRNDNDAWLHEDEASDEVETFVLGSEDGLLDAEHGKASSALVSLLSDVAARLFDGAWGQMVQRDCALVVNYTQSPDGFAEGGLLLCAVPADDDEPPSRIRPILLPWAEHSHLLRAIAAWLESDDIAGSQLMWLHRRHPNTIIEAEFEIRPSSSGAMMIDSSLAILAESDGASPVMGLPSRFGLA